LFVELAGSAIVPPIVLLTRKHAALFLPLLLALALLAIRLGEHTHLGVGVYLFGFVLGASINAWGHLLAPQLAPHKAQLLAVVAFVVLVGFRATGPWGFTVDYHAPVPAIAESFAAATLIAIVAENPVAFSCLRRRPVLWLGDVSYSLYLIHFVLLAMFLQLTSPLVATLPTFAAFVVLFSSVMAAALASSAATYRVIELPGMRLGSRAARAMGNLLSRPRVTRPLQGDPDAI